MKGLHDGNPSPYTRKTRVISRWEGTSQIGNSSELKGGKLDLSI